MSARKYMNDAELIADARYHRGREDEYRRRALTEWRNSVSLMAAHAHMQNAMASEAELRNREIYRKSLA